VTTRVPTHIPDLAPDLVPTIERATYVAGQSKETIPNGGWTVGGGGVMKYDVRVENLGLAPAERFTVTLDCHVILSASGQVMKGFSKSYCWGDQGPLDARTGVWTRKGIPVTPLEDFRLPDGVKEEYQIRATLSVDLEPPSAEMSKKNNISQHIFYFQQPPG
jgi:hypothetical protein